MQYGPSDSSGTDDDLPRTHQIRGGRDGHVSGNRRSSIAHSYPILHNDMEIQIVQNDMEIQIHQIEQEAYTSVLRAFKAQADALTWEKESVITELRRELRVSDDEHRELLSIVNADDMLRRIREWRQTGVVQPNMLNNAQPSHDLATSPVSNSRKRKHTASIPSLSYGAPSPRSQLYANSMQPSSAAQRGIAPNIKSKMTKTGQSLHAGPSLKSSQYALMGPSGRSQGPKRSSSGAVAAAEVAPFDNLIGRKVMTRWPDDNNFYEAVITDYNANEGRHLLVYDINTNNETWEWVNLKEISPEDIRWEGDDPGISNNASRGGPVHGAKNSTGPSSAVPNASRGRGFLKNQSRKQFPPQNGIGKKSTNDIHILHTDTLIREVERVYNSGHPDPLELEKARKALREQEQALIDAIAKLANTSDGESDHQEVRDQGWRNLHGANYGDDMASNYRPVYQDGV